MTIKEALKFLIEVMGKKSGYGSIQMEILKELRVAYGLSENFTNLPDLKEVLVGRSKFNVQDTKYTAAERKNMRTDDIRRKHIVAKLSFLINIVLKSLKDKEQPSHLTILEIDIFIKSLIRARVLVSLMDTKL